MSDVLKSQLEQWVARTEPIGALALLDRVERDITYKGLQQLATQRPPIRRRVPSLVVVSVSAVAVILLAGLVPWIFGASDPIDPAEPPVTVTTLPSSPSTTVTNGLVTTTLPSPPPPVPPPTVGIVDSDDWVAIDGGVHAAFDISGSLGGVIAFNGQWVVIGQNCDDGEFQCSRSVWVSPDLVAWDRHDLAERGSWDTIVEFEGMLVAGGRHYDDDARCSAAVWVSNDAISWERVSTDTAVFVLTDPAPDPQISPCGLDVADFAELDGRLFGVGVDMPTGTAIWASDDGITWARVGEDDPTWPPNGNAFAESIHVVGDNLVVLGSCFAMGECSSFPGTFWVSADAGASWAEANTLGLGPDTNPVFFGINLVAGTPTPRGMMFNGAACEWIDEGDTVSPTRCGPAVWETVDGLVWVSTRLDGDVPDRRDVLETTDPGFVALGFTWATAPDDGPAAWWTWRSPDGTNWDAMPAPLAVDDSINNSTSLGGSVIVVGSHGPLDTADMSPTIWVLTR